MSIITLKQKRELLVSIFGDGNTSGDGKDIAVYCPVCKKSAKTKKKKKLSISIETGVYHCWVCESKGRYISRFVKVNFPKFKELEKIRRFFGSVPESSEETVQEKVISLPEDFKMVAFSRSRTSNYIKDYLYDRGMTTDDFYSFKVGYSFEFGFENRMIFPSFDENLDLNFYVTRTCDDETRYSKYKNCDASKKEVIFNEHLIDWDKPVIIVEGIFDAVKAGNNAIPILGSWVDASYLIFKKIVQKRARVILGLDPDAKDKEMKIAKNLFCHGIEVSILNNKHSDLGDLSKEEVKNLIHNAKPFDNMERMRYLIGGIKSGSMY